jgi:hypothetical protein
VLFSAPPGRKENLRGPHHFLMEIRAMDEFISWAIAEPYRIKAAFVLGGLTGLWIGLVVVPILARS